MRLLIVEDHPTLGRDLKIYLESRAYVVDLIATGEEAEFQGLDVPYDLIILDILLPDISGLEVCRFLREHDQQVPLLFLTALGEVEHRIEGLDMGADDYLVKPVDFRELEARIRALLRRDGLPRSSTLQFADLVLDTRTHEARRGERVIQLSTREYALLDFLMRRPREIVDRTTIAEHVWDYDAEHLSNVVDVYIGYLRAKLCAQGEVNLIQTIRGSGYQLKESR